MKLSKHLVEKPWGRADIPAEFGDNGGRRVGEIWYEAADGKQLPILVKWLFTSDKLSIQVHPNDMEAKARGLESGKEECWYIVDAEPGAVLGMGTIRALSDKELRAASQSGEIEQLMDWKPVKAGDYFYIPAGTVHAIGAGITLVEVQQYADVTYRLYDYGRPRELHLDDGVAVSDARPYTDARAGRVSESCKLVEGPFFDLWYVDSGNALAEIMIDRRRWAVPLQGSAHGKNEQASVGDCLMVEPGDSLELGRHSKALLVGAPKCLH